MDSTPLMDRFAACILGGAIGDAWGSAQENKPIEDKGHFHYWDRPTEQIQPWFFTDDTQLTLATCEALIDPAGFSPAALSRHFLELFNRGGIRGAGASTLKALIELEAGGHWSQVGRSGENAAGNGAAMRIAPLAFSNSITRDDIQKVCQITHRNDEAYVGALSVVFAIRLAISGEWHLGSDLLPAIVPSLPDTRVRDRLIEIMALNGTATIQDVARLGTSGYVVNSVPFALFAASRAQQMGLQAMYEQVIAAGGDTDTNASLAGQVAGARLGLKGIPLDLLEKMNAVGSSEKVHGVISRVQSHLFSEK
jgi:ADP-ribosyl-[dinitrogen reductase] hydrolase